ncbi:unnamed protein product [Ixodes pacificus]
MRPCPVTCLLLLFMLAAQYCRAEDASPAQLQENDKRRPPAAMYGFGLGKRAPFLFLADDAAEQAAERAEAEDEDPDLNYPDKRGERPQHPLRYGFGLGKRLDREGNYPGSIDHNRRERHRFGFGLGKRGKKSEIEDFMKRRYNFGLGKRSAYGGDDGERWKRSLASDHN